MTECKERCETCRFWEAQDAASPASNVMGLCQRFPQFVNHLQCEWCGEWQGKCLCEKVPSLLRQSEVQQLLFCAVKDTKAIMQQMDHVIIGKGDIRVTEASLAKWIQANTRHPTPGE